MRLVHEINNWCQVCGRGTPYAPREGEDRAHDFRVNLTICVEAAPWVDDDEVIHIEGSARYIKRMLQDALDSVELMGEHYVEDGYVEAGWDAERESDEQGEGGRAP